MAERGARASEAYQKAERHFTFLWVPAIVVGVLILGGVTFRTTFQIEKLRQQSIFEATLSLANEKVDRLDKRIVDEDNVVLAVADVATLTSIPRGWPTAARETPTVRAILIIDPVGPSHDVLAFASRAEGGGGPEDDSFRRLLVERIYPDLSLGEPLDELRHLHKVYGGQSYLISYCLRNNGGHPYLVVAWHDVPTIVHDILL